MTDDYTPPVEYLTFVRERLAAGDTPNDIQGDIEQALHSEATDWKLWGTGTWSADTVCQACGSWAAGLCDRSHREAGPPILRREYEARQAATAQNSGKAQTP